MTIVSAGTAATKSVPLRCTCILKFMADSAFRNQIHAGHFFLSHSLVYVLCSCAQPSAFKEYHKGSISIPAEWCVIHGKVQVRECSVSSPSPSPANRKVLQRKHFTWLCKDKQFWSTPKIVTIQSIWSIENSNVLSECCFLDCARERSWHLYIFTWLSTVVFKKVLLFMLFHFLCQGNCNNFFEQFQPQGSAAAERCLGCSVSRRSASWALRLWPWAALLLSHRMAYLQYGGNIQVEWHCALAFEIFCCNFFPSSNIIVQF